MFTYDSPNNKDFDINKKADPNAPWMYPDRPSYEAAYNPSTMSLFDQMQERINGLQADPRGINKYREEALRTGPSAWAQMAGAQQDQEAANSLDKARMASSGKSADARSNLAMRGGLDSGARERVARSGAQGLLQSQQGINQTGATNKMQIGLNDEQNRISQLGALPGMENTALQPAMDQAKMIGQAKQFDITNQANEGMAKNLFNMNKYHEQMQGWAANQQANATANSGKK